LARGLLVSGGLCVLLDFQRHHIVADAYTVAVLQRHGLLDAPTVDEHAVVRVQIFDGVARGTTKQAGVLARHVSLSEANRVALLSADRDEVANEGNDYRLPFVVGDDELKHRSRRSESPSGRGA
jgi:hypothetical protein